MEYLMLLSNKMKEKDKILKSFNFIVTNCQDIQNM